MTVFKCKMCGGSLEIVSGATVAECQYCGTAQTLPKLEDEKRIQLYDRANHFRRENEFDKAMGIYEMIISEDKEDAEAYWGSVLCRYGIEYVEDPRSHKRVPTVNRSQFVSVFEDEDYKNALKYADDAQKAIYTAEASVIDKIQKSILEISNREEPFDIFICYKETDSLGQRTQDSVYAQGIYNALIKEGYKVFFSRITLEDKLGTAYEPYIFAALNSAKVMLVIGTSKENFNAVWVKNEWSRYLNLMKNQQGKTLIPIYKNMSPYDMPEEFQYLQSQDMGKVGFLQDIIHGINKLIAVAPAPAAQAPAETTSVIVDTMLKRAAEAMAAKDWQKASRCYDNMLDYDDRNEQAYLGKMLIDMRASSLDELKARKVRPSTNGYYAALTQNRQTSLAKLLVETDREIAELIAADEKAEAEKKQRSRKKTRKVFLIIICIILAAVLSVAAVFAVKNYVIPGMAYNKAEKLMENGSYDEAIAEFNKLGDFKNSSDMVSNCFYLKITELIEMGRYSEAKDVLSSSGLLESNYNGSSELQKECIYLIGKEYYMLGKYSDAILNFESVADYKDSAELINECNYNLAAAAFDSSDYDGAIDFFTKANGFSDSNERIKEAYYIKGDIAASNGDLDSAIRFFEQAADFGNAAELRSDCLYNKAEQCYSAGNYDEAITLFGDAGDYNDAAERVLSTTYEAGQKCFSENRYLDAMEYFKQIPDYKDASTRVNESKYQYCVSTQNDPTGETKVYIRELVSLGYKNSSAVAKNVFAWKADITMKASLRIGSMTGVSFTAKLRGGDDTSTKVKFVVTVQGETLTCCDDKLYKAGDEPSCQITNSMRDITQLRFAVRAYDSKGNLIGQANGIPEGF